MNKRTKTQDKINADLLFVNADRMDFRLTEENYLSRKCYDNALAYTYFYVDIHKLLRLERKQKCPQNTYLRKKSESYCGNTERWFQAVMKTS